MRRDPDAYEERCEVYLVNHTHPEHGVVFAFSPGETPLRWERTISLEDATILLRRYDWEDAGHMVGSTRRVFRRTHVPERPIEDVMAATLEP
jgi:hypothetical protein